MRCWQRVTRSRQTGRGRARRGRRVLHADCGKPWQCSAGRQRPGFAVQAVAQPPPGPGRPGCAPSRPTGQAAIPAGAGADTAGHRLQHRCGHTRTGPRDPVPGQRPRPPGSPPRSPHRVRRSSARCPYATISSQPPPSPINAAQNASPGDPGRSAAHPPIMSGMTHRSNVQEVCHFVLRPLQCRPCGGMSRQWRSPAGKISKRVPGNGPLCLPLCHVTAALITVLTSSGPLCPEVSLAGAGLTCWLAHSRTPRREMCTRS